MQISQEKLPFILKNFFENANEKIFILNKIGKVIAMNRAAKHILTDEMFAQMVAGKSNAICMACRGYTTIDELRTCTSCYVANSNKDLASFQVYLETVGKGVIPYSASIQTVDEENEIRVLMLRDLSEHIKTQETLHQKLLMNRVMKAQEDERKRISRELHDSVAQEMLSLLVDIRVVKYMTKNEEVVNKIRETEGTLMRLLEDIQHLSVELRPATLDDLGLESAFRAHFKSIDINYGIVVHFQSNIDTNRYEGEIETAVYRICQEAVLNAIKYANVDEVTVKLLEENNQLCLHIIDDGCGFELENASPQGTGLGLYGMKERAELINGVLSIHSAIDKGTYIRLVTPIEEGGASIENHHC